MLIRQTNKNNVENAFIAMLLSMDLRSILAVSIFITLKIKYGSMNTDFHKTST